MKRCLAAVAVAFLALFSVRADGPSPEAAATIVIYNRNQAESLALAKYYAKKRHIPAGHLVGLDCSDKEAILRDEYLVDIEAPLRRAFDENSWWKISRASDGRRFVEKSSIRFAAVMRGVPLKIRPLREDPSLAPADTPRRRTPGAIMMKRNEASVDSELAAMFSLLEQAPSAIQNSYYRRYAHILSVPAAGSPLLVCRLDGPSAGIVRRMIDDAITAEETGLWGWAYLDARSTHDPGYIEGDEWITRAGELMRRQGVPVISDYAPETWLRGFPVTNAAIYYGWYDETVSGPFADPNFRFPPGAIAVHLHSYSARTVRNPEVAWAGPLLARGATATMGNVSEPYLSFTVNFDILQDRLMGGMTLAESAYAAMRGLSWMGVVLGDPLYRPYAQWQEFDDSAAADNPWRHYRKIVLAAGDPIAAAPKLREFAVKSKNSMPLEALGQAQAAVGDINDALHTLADASELEKSKTIRFRLILEQIEILRRAGRQKAALQKIADALGDFRSDEQQVTLGQLTLILRPAPPSPTPANRRR